MNWTVTILIICCLLAVFAIWMEYSRTEKRNRVLRIIASLLAVAALAGIILPINYTRDVTATDNNSAVLLTPGFEPDSLKNYPPTKIFTADRTIQQVYPKAKLIRLDELKNDTPAISSLRILGYGLDESELNQLGDLPVTFHPALLAGVTAINWQQQITSGQVLTVQGKYKNVHSRPIKLVLSGLNTQLDTTTIAASSAEDFVLNTVPKHDGRAVYHLQAIAGKDTLENESVPVEVKTVKPLKILILSTSPDFETRFLKNWLSGNGYAVAVRSAISKNKFSSEYVNMSTVKTEYLNASLLSQFDVVIGDLSVLKSVGSAEASSLKQQVTEKGLGLIIRADSSSKTVSWLQKDFPVEKQAVKEGTAVPLQLTGKQNKTTALKIDPSYIGLQIGTQPLVHDEHGHILVNSSLAGAGRLVFTTVNNSFNWMLAGDKEDYSAWWSLLISKAVRKEPVIEEWSVSHFPVPNKPAILQLATASSPQNIHFGWSLISPMQSAGIPFEWTSVYWPQAEGWQSVMQQNGQLAWWYVYNTHEWAGVKASQKIASTRYYAGNHPVGQNVTKPIHNKVRIEVPKIYFYILLLAACVFLWVEGKGLVLPAPKGRVYKMQ